MAHTRNWDNADPADTDAASAGAQEIREFKEDVGERVESVFNDIDDDPMVLKTGYVPNVKGNPASITFEDTGETTPLGKFRILDDGDKLTIQKRNAGDDGWEDMLSFDRTNLRIGPPASTLDANGFALACVRGLVVINNATNPNHQVDVDADEALLPDANGDLLRVAAINLTVDITEAGANGLDTGDEGAAAWYFIYIIAKSDGTVAGLLSTSATTPTMPEGYTYKLLISAVRNTADSDFLRYKQIGKRVYYISTSARLPVLADGTEAAYTQVDGTARIPSIALEAIYDVYLYGNGGQGGALLSLDGTNNFAEVGVESNSGVQGAQVCAPMVTAGSIWYKVTNAGMLDLNVQGYILRELF